VFVIRGSDGVTLVDCGYGTDEAFQILDGGLREIGIGWSGITRVLHTHAHPDHAGNSARIAALTDAPVLMHGREIEYLGRFQTYVDTPEVLDPWLLSWGTAPAEVARITDSFRAMAGTFRPAQAVTAIEEGTRLDGWHVVATPGHAPGHLCLCHAQQRILISGDHVLEAISPNIAWMENGDPLGAYLDSLDKVAGLDVVRVVPSHGDEFTGLAGRCRHLAEHHRQRCAAVLEAIGAGDTTAQQMVERLWQRALSPFQHRFALFEVMAHLAYLERKGEVACERGGPVEHWSLTGGTSRAPDAY